MNTFSWWSYPYIKFLENYVPLAFLILFLFCFLLCIFGLINYVAIKKNKSYIKARVIWQGNIISDMFRYFVYAILIMAFAETDKEYILYKIIKDSISFFRQIDAFLYAVFLLQFIMALRFKNCYTYINKLLNSLVFVNFIEIIALVFLKYNNGEKGTLSTGLRLVLIFFVIFLNCILINTKFCNYTRHSNLKVNESDLFKTRVNQMDEILSKIVTYDKEEQITIFLSDEWGGGKTFFAKYLFNQLRKASNYNLIWVNLTDFSQEEVFIKQVFKKIQGELNNKSYYTGESSEFEKYLSAALNISLDQSVANVISEKVAVNNKSKIEKNALLSEMSDEISEMLGNDRIVILIDDMDRCTDETIKAALKLFSEIIFLPKSIIIFVGDYKQLLSKPGFEDGFLINTLCLITIYVRFPFDIF